MKNKLIIFTHHYVNDNIKDRFLNVKKLNPNWDIISAGFDNYDLLPNSSVVSCNKYPTNKQLIKNLNVYNEDWANPDLILYDIYFKFPDYKEYFLYEYDTISNVSIDSFFNTNVDFFGNNIRTPADENWYWILQYRKLNSNNYMFKNLHSYGQSTCIYFKNHILKYCAEEVLKNKHLYCEMLSEIRGGTLVNQITTLKKGRIDIENFISWTPNEIKINLNIPYFYHPVK
jgi:hypothetical protein